MARNDKSKPAKADKAAPAKAAKATAARIHRWRRTSDSLRAATSPSGKTTRVNTSWRK